MLGVEEMLEMVELNELMEELLGDLVEEDKVPYLLLYLWLWRGVEFLSCMEVVLGDEE